MATDGFAVTSPAVLGGTFGASVSGCAPGNIGALLVAYFTPLTASSPWGEVLVNITDPSGELLGMPLSLGTPAVFSMPIPHQPLYPGLVVFTQAASFGGSICLHCAYECTVGY